MPGPGGNKWRVAWWHGRACGALLVSAYVMNPWAGYFSAWSSARADVTGASISEFVKEFGGLRSGNISVDETTKARATSRMDLMQTFAGLRGIIDSGTTSFPNRSN